MGKEHNISEANRQLGDTTYFKRLDQDPTSDLQRLLNEKLTEMLTAKEISEDNIEYLTVANPNCEEWSEESHSFENIMFCCIEANDTWTDVQRKMRETYWIQRLNAVQA